MAGLLTAAQTTAITATVSSSLDQSLPLYRNANQGVSSDGYGHSTNGYPGSPTHTIACTVGKPSASILQEYAGIIGSRRSLMLRALGTTDIKQTDRVVYDGLNWEVQAVLNANSYSVTKTYIMTAVA